VSAAVYSARNEGKAHCFDLIAERFGSDCNYVAIGMFHSSAVIRRWEVPSTCQHLQDFVVSPSSLFHGLSCIF